MTGTPERIPVHVLTGFLGSGKTTFLNELLKGPGFERTAVIINEFGETGLDHLFLEGREEGVFELSNGCLCCTIRSELAATLLSLPQDRIDRVLVETTGLADPVPILQSIIGSHAVSSLFEIAGMITIVDSLNVVEQMAAHREARLQVALADLLIVTKLDMLDPVARSERANLVVRGLRALNPLAKVLMRDQFTPSAAILDLAAGQALAAGLAEAGRSGDGHGHGHAHGHGHGHRHVDHHHHDVNRHGDRIRSAVLTMSRPMRRQAIEMFCELMTSAHASSLLRLKGLVAIEGSERPLVIHAVHGVFHEPRQLDRWPDDNRETRIVVILEDLDPDFVRRLLSAFADIPTTDMPDSEALINNPLGIPGYSA
jgi:G3E family GTPase